VVGAEGAAMEGALAAMLRGVGAGVGGEVGAAAAGAVETTGGGAVETCVGGAVGGGAGDRMGTTVTGGADGTVGGTCGGLGDGRRSGPSASEMLAPTGPLSGIRPVELSNWPPTSSKATKASAASGRRETVRTAECSCRWRAAGHHAVAVALSVAGTDAYVNYPTGDSRYQGTAI
jgi:hypothetical protein